MLSENRNEKGKNVADKLIDILSKTTKPEDEEDLGACASRPVVKYVPAFHVKNAKEPTRSFEYAHVGLKQYEPGKFVLEFNEPEKWRLTVEGTNLWKVYNYLVLHRLEWIEAADRPFGDGKQPVISKITIEAVEEE